jgi:Fe-S-cluster containining protein
MTPPAKAAAARFDCMSCGACCTNPEENRAERFADYVEVIPGDSLLQKPLLARRFVVFRETGAAHLRLDEGGRCWALRGRIGRRVRCEIYAHRPAACRKVEPGGASCLRHRREQGLGERDS